METCTFDIDKGVEQMKKSELKSIVRLLAKENRKLKRRIKELEASDNIVREIDDIVGRWFRVEGIENGDQALQEINELTTEYMNSKS